MVESTQWNVIENLFGLVVCPVPHTLKARIYSTIAAFAVDSDNANKVLSPASILREVQFSISVYTDLDLSESLPNSQYIWANQS